jgi:adenylate kinase
MKLILFGGVKGVGKTTTLTWIKNKLGRQVTLLDPGELFRRYFYVRQIKTLDEIEELIIDKLEKMPADATVAIHWHYAVKRPTGYIPQISFSRLERLARSSKIEKIILLLMEAPLGAIKARRLKDYKTKRRGLSFRSIKEEIAMDEKFLKKHKALLSKTLGGHRVEVLRLKNIDLKVTEVTLGKIFRSYLAK